MSEGTDGNQGLHTHMYVKQCFITVVLSRHLLDGNFLTPIVCSPTMNRANIPNLTAYYVVLGEANLSAESSAKSLSGRSL